MGDRVAVCRVFFFFRCYQLRLEKEEDVGGGGSALVYPTTKAHRNVVLRPYRGEGWSRTFLFDSIVYEEGIQFAVCYKLNDVVCIATEEVSWEILGEVSPLTIRRNSDLGRLAFRNLTQRVFVRTMLVIARAF